MTRLLVLDTGGTIGTAMTSDGRLFHGDRSQAQPLAEAVARRLGIEVEVQPVQAFWPEHAQPVDSCEVGPRHWTALAAHVLAAAESHSAVVILHGTDTLAYTASALAFMLAALPVPVVLTGSQLSPHEHRSDAEANLDLAMTAAAGVFGDLGAEVVVAFGGRLMRGCRSTKVSVSSHQAFASPGFAAIDVGAQEDVARGLAAWSASHPAGALTNAVKLDQNVWLTDVWPGLDRERLVTAVESLQPSGVVVRLFGVGTSPTVAGVEALAEQLASRGAPMLAISAVTAGMLDWGRYERTWALPSSPMINGQNMTVEAALTKMMWVIANSEALEVRRALLGRNLVGEMG